MAIYQGEISGIGNSATRKNEITAEDVATTRHFIVGWDGGVIKGFDEDTTKRTSTSLTLNGGTMFAYSYFGHFPDTYTFHFNQTAAMQYHFIYAEIDRSIVPNTAKLKVKNNQAGKEIKPTTFRQDVLSAVKTGVYQLPLYRITLNESGIAAVEDVRDIRKAIKKVAYANQTHKITETISSTAMAITRPVSANDTTVATTLFVHNACRDYIDNDGGTIAYSVTITPRDIDETGKITFSTNKVAININNRTATFTAIVQQGWVIDDYISAGQFTVTRSGNQFTVDLGDYVPTEAESWYINFYLTQE